MASFSNTLEQISTISETPRVLSMKVSVGISTHIGGGAGFLKENQDVPCTFKITINDNEYIIVIINDGHGDMHGKTIATHFKNFATKYLNDHMAEIETNLIELLKALFREGDVEINHIYKSGGTTSTILIIDTTSGIVTCANVGDSTANIFSLHENLSNSLRVYSTEESNAPSEMANYLPLSHDHSPEDKNEHSLVLAEILPKIREKLNILLNNCDNNLHNFFNTLTDSVRRKYYRYKLEDIRQLIKIDSFCLDFLYERCDGIDGYPILNESGQDRNLSKLRGLPNMYFKNTRKDWASSVTTPFGKLAMSKSIGDEYISASTPTIQQFQLSPVISDEDYLCITVCTDGVWDNWLDSDARNFLLHADQLSELTLENGATRVSEKFIRENDIKGIANFGGRRDNASCACIYIKKN